VRIRRSRFAAGRCLRALLPVDPGLRVEEKLADGVRAGAGDVLWLVEGSARSILMAERTALNFAQRPEAAWPR